MISTSSTQVASGVSLVGETGKALARISEQVAEINGIVSEIAASAQEQAVGLHLVNTAINQMDQMTQQNAAMVEESTAASHSLATETQTLANLIGQFNVGREASVAKFSASRNPAAARPSIVKSPALPIIRGNTALAYKSDIKNAAEAREEF